MYQEYGLLKQGIDMSGIQVRILYVYLNLFDMFFVVLRGVFESCYNCIKETVAKLEKQQSVNLEDLDQSPAHVSCQFQSLCQQFRHGGMKTLKEEQ